MRILFFISFFISTLIVNAQTSTNSTGSGNFNNTTTWTSPRDLTGTANILNGHTVTIPATTTVYSDKITFSGSAKLELASATSKWVASTILNPSPPLESLNNQNNWTVSSVWAGDGYGASHHSPWIDSYQGWSAGSAFSGNDFIIYDLRNIRWVQGIMTQGRRIDIGQWVTSAKIEVSPDNINWVTVATNAPLNTDMNSKVSFNFPKVMFARYIKVTPTGVRSHLTMRLGILLREDGVKSCKDILNLYPNSSSGVYMIDPDGPSGALPSTNCYCDMTTDGGGWTLILNYLHAANTNPALNPRTNSLPILGSTTLGIDESTSTTTWGHVSPTYLNNFSFTELRFYGKTSGHNRIIHFKSSHLGTINYFKSGTGSVSGIQSGFTPLASHNAFIPNSAASFFTDKGINAMTDFPFWHASNFHWGIRGGSSNNRWEVDDFPASIGSGFQNSTHHQIWIR